MKINRQKKLFDAKLLRAAAQFINAYKLEPLVYANAGLTLSSIARLTDASKSAVKDRYQRGKEQIEGLLQSRPEHEFWDAYLAELDDGPKAKAIRELRKSAISREKARQTALDEKQDSSSAESRHIDDMGFSHRTHNAFKAIGFSTVAEIQDMSTREFLRIRNLGKKSLIGVIKTLERAGYDPQFD